MFNGKILRELAATKAGYLQVKQVLDQLDHGFCA